MEDWYEHIDDYLDGSLSDAERTAFEARVATDPELAATLAQVREARERLSRLWTNEPADAALRQTLHGLGAQYFKSARPPATGSAGPGTRRLLGWAMAAGLALLLAAWFFFLRPPVHEQLYAQYRHFPAASFTEMGSAPAATSLPDAAAAFNREDYGAALPALLAYQQAHPAELEPAFFAGLCQLELKHYPEARALFGALMTTPNAWSGEARWYVALSYLRENRRDACANTLRNIRPGEAHYEEAQALLKGI